MSLASHCQNDEGQTEEADDTKDQAKGYAVGKNNFITVEDDELISFKLESTRTIEIDIFVPQKKIDPVILTPYYTAHLVETHVESHVPLVAQAKMIRFPGASCPFFIRRDHLALIKAMLESIQQRRSRRSRPRSSGGITSFKHFFTDYRHEGGGTLRQWIPAYSFDPFE
jgi:hypothetical protein